MKNKILGFLLFVLSIVILWRFVYLFVPWQWHVYAGWFSCSIYRAAFDWENEVKKNINLYQKW